MDVILSTADKYLFTKYIYPQSWPEDNCFRQFLSIFVIITILAYIQYFVISGLSYFLMYDRRLLKHKHFLPNQVRKEIAVTCKSLPVMAFITTFLFVAEVRGYSQLYENIEDYGWTYLILSSFFFLFFTDMCIYWIHRGLHHPKIYKHLHKMHHLWIVPTPFASYAFHPVDGFLQSSPYHLFVFLFPLQKWMYLGLFMVVNFWTTSIHDANYQVPNLLRGVLNCSAHHTDHHLFFNYNYGQFFTLWDKIGGSHRFPSGLEGNGPLDLMLRQVDLGPAPTPENNGAQKKVK